jgi:hypothetical protein
MNFQSLLVSSDDRVIRILRNVLGELEIDVEHCADPAGLRVRARTTLQLGLDSVVPLGQSFVALQSK